PPRDRVAPRPRPTAPALKLLSPGQVAFTGAGQKVRLRLEDGSVVSLNQKTRLRLDAERKLNLIEGEVFVEVASAKEGTSRRHFVISAPRREVTVLGTRLAVRAERQGTSVLVTQGRAKVDG